MKFSVMGKTEGLEIISQYQYNITITKWIEEKL